MTSVFRLTGLFIVALAALVAALSIAPKSVDAAGTTIDCEVPNSIVCQISNPDGIKHVTVTMMTGLGPVDVVDESFNCRTSVTVSWDPIVPNAYFDVETCDGFKFDSGRHDGRDSVQAVNKLAVVEADAQQIMVGLILVLEPHGEPRIDDLTAEEVFLEDFYCGGKNHVPCDDTFSDFCAKVANGTEIELPSGHGACITPGGWNPDGAP